MAEMTNGPRDQQGPSQSENLTTTEDTSQPCLTDVPACYDRVGDGPCRDVDYCQTRSQLMCGGHVVTECDSDAAIRYGLDGAVAAIPPAELRALRRGDSRPGGDRRV